MLPRPQHQTDQAFPMRHAIISEGRDQSSLEDESESEQADEIASESASKDGNKTHLLGMLGIIESQPYFPKRRSEKQKPHG